MTGVADSVLESFLPVAEALRDNHDTDQTNLTRLQTDLVLLGAVIRETSANWSDLAEGPHKPHQSGITDARSHLLMGRGPELQNIHNALSECGKRVLVCLDGPIGIGKAAIAEAAALHYSQTNSTTTVLKVDFGAGFAELAMAEVLHALHPALRDTSVSPSLVEDFRCATHNPNLILVVLHANYGKEFRKFMSACAANRVLVTVDGDSGHEIVQEFARKNEWPWSAINIVPISVRPLSCESAVQLCRRLVPTRVTREDETEVLAALCQGSPIATLSLALILAKKPQLEMFAVESQVNELKASIHAHQAKRMISSSEVHRAIAAAVFVAIQHLDESVLRVLSLCCLVSSAAFDAKLLSAILSKSGESGDQLEIVESAVAVLAQMGLVSVCDEISADVRFQSFRLHPIVVAFWLTVSACSTPCQGFDLEPTTPLLKLPSPGVFAPALRVHIFAALAAAQCFSPVPDLYLFHRCVHRLLPLIAGCIRPSIFPFDSDAQSDREGPQCRHFLSLLLRVECAWFGQSLMHLLPPDLIVRECKDWFLSTMRFLPIDTVCLRSLVIVDALLQEGADKRGVPLACALIQTALEKLSSEGQTTSSTRAWFHCLLLMRLGQFKQGDDAIWAYRSALDVLKQVASQSAEMTQRALNIQLWGTNMLVRSDPKAAQQLTELLQPLIQRSGHVRRTDWAAVRQCLTGIQDPSSPNQSTGSLIISPIPLIIAYELFAKAILTEGDDWGGLCKLKEADEICVAFGNIKERIKILVSMGNAESRTDSDEVHATAIQHWYMALDLLDLLNDAESRERSNQVRVSVAKSLYSKDPNQALSILTPVLVCTDSSATKAWANFIRGLIKAHEVAAEFPSQDVHLRHASVAGLEILPAHSELRQQRSYSSDEDRISGDTKAAQLVVLFSGCS
eukprot:c19322_g1_i1.p1 GENE.c19322_g1_i1~~c19322_g1_i1.p1  ORF type:complete len:956 (+),score=184.19 c19322_g1_i1:147-2870(+)